MEQLHNKVESSKKKKKKKASRNSFLIGDHQSAPWIYRCCSVHISFTYEFSLLFDWLMVLLSANFIVQFPQCLGLQPLSAAWTDRGWAQISKGVQRSIINNSKQLRVCLWGSPMSSWRGWMPQSAEFANQFNGGDCECLACSTCSTYLQLIYALNNLTYKMWGTISLPNNHQCNVL